MKSETAGKRRQGGEFFLGGLGSGKFQTANSFHEKAGVSQDSFFFFSSFFLWILTF
jgi:hypothetical protein